MKIKAIRFEPGTITPDAQPKRLDVVTQSEAAPLTSDANGVWVGSLFFPWHRAHCVDHEPDALPVGAVPLAIVRHPETPPAPPKGNKRR